jgi:hypothetical protein
VAVGVDGLAEERHVPNPSLGERRHLAHDVRHRAADLLAPPVRDDAVGAEEVAAVDDRDVGGDLRVRGVRNIVVGQADEIVLELVELRDHLRELGEVRGVEEEVDVRECRLETLLLLRDHAPRQDDPNVGPLALEADQRVQLAGDLVLAAWRTTHELRTTTSASDSSGVGA